MTAPRRPAPAAKVTKAQQAQTKDSDDYYAKHPDQVHKHTLCTDPLHDPVATPHCATCGVPADLWTDEVAS